MKTRSTTLVLKAIKAPIAISLCVIVFSTHAQIYVASSAGGYVAEYAISGATINSSLIPGLGYPWGMIWDGDGTLYVAQDGSRTVGKYTTSGVTINRSLISIHGDPVGVALDGNGHVFVVDGLFGTVGEYTTSGEIINATLISGLTVGGFASIVCDGNGHLFAANSAASSIAEYTTSGALVNAALISVSGVYSMACDRSGHLFVTRQGFRQEFVGEYTTSGDTVNASLVSGGDDRQFGIALDGNGHLFVSNYSRGTISEYTTEGALINAALVTGLFEPIGLVVATPPPTISCSAPLLLECTNGGAIGTITAAVQDTNGSSLEIVWAIDGISYQTNTIPSSGGTLTVSNLIFTAHFSFGEHLVVVSASNGQNAPASCPTAVTVRDTMPPEIVSIVATPSLLWPPDHRMVPVTLDIEAVDNCDASPSTRISKVISNQPENRFAPDWEITGAHSVNLRAERLGNWGERVYTIFVGATDSAGHATTRMVNITVPKSKSGNGLASLAVDGLGTRMAERPPK